MNRKIRNIFCDSNNEIFIVDENDILYLYDRTNNTNGDFYPFTTIMTDIKKCCRINNYFFIYHAHTISYFDSNLIEINIQNDESNESNESIESWITHNIDDVCYDSKNKIIVTLEHGEVHVNLNVSGDEISRISLSHIYKSGKYILYTKYDAIKIIDSKLLIYGKGVMNFFDLKMTGIDRVGSMEMDLATFLDIDYYDTYYGAFSMKNGIKISLDSRFYACASNNHDIVTKEIFKKYNFFISLSPDSNEPNENNNNKGRILSCYYYEFKYETIVEPLHILIPHIAQRTLICPDEPGLRITSMVIPQSVDIQILPNTSQIIIIYYDGSYYLADEILHEILLSDELINVDRIASYYPEKTETKLVIDIDISKSVIEQVIHIIPAIYRLNNEMIYHFEQTDQNGNVLSYGEGVTRQIFNSMRKELDLILSTNLQGYSVSDAFKLGKLLYVCNRDGCEAFSNLHPYVFFLLSKDSDSITLLKKFKGADFNILMKQYKEYVSDPSKLEDLELNLKTSRDYIRYLLTSDLNTEQIIVLDEFVRGFKSLASRNKLYQVIQYLPIYYYINKLVVSEYFDAELEYNAKYNQDIAAEDFLQFRELFKRLFDNLSKKEKSTFLQNVTGSQYYSDIVHIVLGYKFPNNFITDAVIQDEDHLTDFYHNNLQNTRDIENIENLENINENSRDIENIDINTRIMQNLENISDLSYYISTCNAELIINVNPSEANLKIIIDMLTTTEDTFMKN